MMMSDRSLNCRKCGSRFLFSIGEQEYFQTKGLSNEPKKCPNCRVLCRVERDGKDVNTTTEVSCDQCGTATRVPFQPRGHKPVLCTLCLVTAKQNAPKELASA
ncbi:MAG: zinc-ribbon domain-containing protein [Candidatus Obscuribacterales bacterium]|nr:zinc-ribbon domain-containing protein [Candidatus Obscuribacterales bacterium]